LGLLPYFNLEHYGVNSMTARFAQAAFWFGKAAALFDPSLQHMLGMTHAKDRV
jgi:TPR repeat protein